MLEGEQVNEIEPISNEEEIFNVANDDGKELAVVQGTICW